MMDKKLSAEDMATARENISRFKGSMNSFFNSKIWAKLAPVVTMIYGDRKRDEINLVDFTDNVICTLSNLYSKFGYDIGYNTLESLFSDIIIEYYYQMMKIDVNEGAYFDKYSFDALNRLIKSLDQDDIKVLDLVFNKLMDIVEK